MDLPIYFIEISEDMADDNGVNFVSIVDKPAIQRDYLKFKEHLKYVADEKQIVTGPAVIVDLPIYRKMEGREFYTVFDRMNTERLVKKWALNQKYNAVNTDHETPIQSMFLFESYLINRERGINPPKGFEEVPDGSWFLSYYVQDPELWNKIKAGEFNGFSVEGLFGLAPKSEEIEGAKEFAEAIDNFCATLENAAS